MSKYCTTFSHVLPWVLTMSCFFLNAFSSSIFISLFCLILSFLCSSHSFNFTNPALCLSRFSSASLSSLLESSSHLCLFSSIRALSNNASSASLLLYYIILLKFWCLFYLSYWLLICVCKLKFIFLIRLHSFTCSIGINYIIIFLVIHFLE